MLTEVKAYSSWRSAPTLPLEGSRAETDLIQVRGITGLDPVKASINTSPYGSVDGASYVGSSLTNRNIVLTLHPNPDWDNWTHEKLRQLLYSYFMPKRNTRLVFLSDDKDPVEISGIVEGVQANMFTKDPELQVSVICPDPYFISVQPKVITGQTIPLSGPSSGQLPTTIDYKGTIEAGIKLKVTATPDPAPADITVQLGDPPISSFGVVASVDPTSYFELSSIPLRKYVQNVAIGTGVITNLLSKVNVQEGSAWPLLQPGENEFAVITDKGTHDWELTYFERFGGL